MLEFLKPVRRGASTTLMNATAADAFWQLLPRDNPIAAQRHVSEVLSDLAGRYPLGLGRFRALLALDQLARDLVDVLLADAENAGGDAQSPRWGAAQSAFALCRSFARAFETALRQILSNELPRGWREHVTNVLLRLFQHRQVEFLLRPFASENSGADCWPGLHAAYRYAEAVGVRLEPLPSRRCGDGRSERSTLEREYLQVLLIQLFNDGRLSPLEAFWLSRRIPAWSAALSLRMPHARVGAERTDGCFVVDLDGASGLAQWSGPPSPAHRYLDPAPLLARIRDDVASLGDPGHRAKRASRLRREREARLLRTLGTICTPNRAPIDRRGERLPLTSTVEAVVGLAQIAGVLRDATRAKPAIRPPGIGATADAADRSHRAVTTAAPCAADTAARSRASRPAGASAAKGEVWQLKDRSESGCRFRGTVGVSNRVVPGALVAFRVRGDLRWTVAVVRRVRKRIGDRVDFGVEFIGDDPVVVKLSADDGDGATAHAMSGGRRNTCRALQLAESSVRSPTPLRTLLVPPAESGPGRVVRLRADGVWYRIRMREAIAEQDGFAWLPYEVVSAGATDGPVEARPDADGPTGGPRPDASLGAPPSPDAFATEQHGGVPRITGARTG